MRAALVGRRTSQRLFAFAISRQVYTFISYQGRSPSSRAVGAVDLRPWSLAANFGSPRRCDHRLRNMAGKEYYRYDGYGRRTLSYSPTLGNLFYMYGQDGTLRYMSDARRTKNEHYVYLGSSLVAIREVAGSTTTVKYQHTDALGSPAAVTNSVRVVIETSEREPFGKLLNRPMHDGPGYTGHAEDAETGLTYMQQRYYDASAGTFLSVDPVSAYETPGQNFNRFWYANNNPYTNKDPDGRLCIGQTSGYCDRSERYDELDAQFSGGTADTTYFGAVSDMTENLANMDLFGGKTVAGVTPAVDQYLNALSQGIAAFNEGQAAKINNGQIKEVGKALDLRLVKDEQKFIQKSLNSLQTSDRTLYTNVISTMNFNANRSDVFGAINSLTDSNIARAASKARAELGRSINFGSESDRNVMGKYMTEVRRPAP